MNYPKSLFKYSKFSNYTLDMIDNEYIYFCPANKLDDQFECLCNWSKYENIHIQAIYSAVKEVLLKLGILVPDIPLNELYTGTKFDKDKAIKYLKEHEKDFSNEKENIFLELIKSLENSSLPTELKEGVEKIVLMHNTIGICSLAEENINQVMWVMYANNYNGYCIEYDIDCAIKQNHDLIDNLVKVKYTNMREIDLFNCLLKSFYSKLLFNIDTLNDDEFKKKIVDIVSSKNKDWSFQKEWRFIGKSDSKDIHLPIKAIYLGKNLSKTNAKKIINACKKKKIPIYFQKDNFVSLEINFEMNEECKL